jgi:uncharacterized membrane protein
MMNYYYPYNMHSGFLFGGFFSFLWFIFICWLFITIFRRLFGHHPSSDFTFPKNDSLEILKKRYAQGEISKKEFDQIKKDIS